MEMMDQTERRMYLIQSLLNEQAQYRGIKIPQDVGEQKRLLRALMNVRPPRDIDSGILRVQDEYLQEELAQKGITDYSSLCPVEEGVYLWKGDITTLRCDGIVNAANSGLTGCYRANHTCIDNCIHTFGGMQMRLACNDIIRKQGHEEPAGQAKITPGFNLPCKYVLHTVGPVIESDVHRRDEELLSSCYRSCLELAGRYGLTSLAFCCISTGVFRFPNQQAAEIAVQTVRKYRTETAGRLEVIFNVFTELDYRIYRDLLGCSEKAAGGPGER
jgi:O-acetyl-ADP-ribose deacetylase (regulator of RNase III)